MLRAQAYEQSLRMIMEMLGTEASKSLVHALTVILVHCPEGRSDTSHVGPQLTLCQELSRPSNPHSLKAWMF
jgi:hypothetical protein